MSFTFLYDGFLFHNFVEESLAVYYLAIHYFPLYVRQFISGVEWEGVLGETGGSVFYAEITTEFISRPAL